MKTYWAEIHFKGGTVPLIRYNLTLEAAERLFAAAAHGWIVRRVGDSAGKVIMEEKQ